MEINNFREEILKRFYKLENEIKKMNIRIDKIEQKQNELTLALSNFKKFESDNNLQFKKIRNDLYKLQNSHKEDYEIKFLIDENDFPKINKKDIENNEGIPFTFKVINIGKYEISNVTKIICNSLNNEIFFYSIQIKEGKIISMFSIFNENNYENYDEKNYLIPGEIIELTIKIFFIDNIEITSNEYSLKLNIETSDNIIIKYDEVIIKVLIEKDDEKDVIISSKNKINFASNLIKINNSNTIKIETEIDNDDSVRS